MTRTLAIVIWLTLVLAGLMIQLVARSNPTALRAMPANTRLSSGDLDGLHVNDRVGLYLRTKVAMDDEVKASNLATVPQLDADGRAVFAATITSSLSVVPNDDGLLCSGKTELSKAEVIAVLCPTIDACFVLARPKTGSTFGAPLKAPASISFQKTCK